MLTEQYLPIPPAMQNILTIKICDKTKICQYNSVWLIKRLTNLYSWLTLSKLLNNIQKNCCLSLSTMTTLCIVALASICIYCSKLISLLQRLIYFSFKCDKLWTCYVIFINFNIILIYALYKIIICYSSHSLIVPV
jgi:hypothetical protein